jgi:hypothetical protein
MDILWIAALCLLCAGVAAAVRGLEQLADRNGGER